MTRDSTRGISLSRGVVETLRAFRCRKLHVCNLWKEEGR